MNEVSIVTGAGQTLVVNGELFSIKSREHKN
ncbi:hypothetical protein ASN86_00506 [Streptococcus parauberis]|nr:hypothetical protein ASN86_00506 [Streptococcus parauberis]